MTTQMTQQRRDDNKELLEFAAKAAGLLNPRVFEWDGDLFVRHAAQGVWRPLTDDGDALRLAIKLRINILFNGGFHHVGTNHWVTDICCLGGIKDIRWEIVKAAAEIGKAMP